MQNVRELLKTIMKCNRMSYKSFQSNSKVHLGLRNYFKGDKIVNHIFFFVRLGMCCFVY